MRYNPENKIHNRLVVGAIAAATYGVMSLLGQYSPGNEVRISDGEIYADGVTITRISANDLVINPHPSLLERLTLKSNDPNPTDRAKKILEGLCGEPIDVSPMPKVRTRVRYPEGALPQCLTAPEYRA